MTTKPQTPEAAAVEADNLHDQTQQAISDEVAKQLADKWRCDLEELHMLKEIEACDALMLACDAIVKLSEHLMATDAKEQPKPTEARNPADDEALRKALNTIPKSKRSGITSMADVYAYRAALKGGV